MSVGTDSGESEGGAPPKLSVIQRFLLVLPRVRRDKEKQPISDWMRSTFLKPVDPAKAAAAKAEAVPETVEELEYLAKSTDDKERAFGLIAAPLAAGIGFLVLHALIGNDPAKHLANGNLNPHYVNPSLYDELFVVLLVLSLLMLTFSLLRKRLLLGVVTALYGLGIFNLHYWGFGIPFIMLAAWYLVRSYRLQRDLKLATGQTSRFSARGQATTTSGSKPEANKRYTPRSNSGRSARTKPTNQKKAG